MERYLVFSIFICLLMCVDSAYAPEPQKFKIYVSVSAEKEDETERNIIESHVKRELRLLGNVVIVSKDDDWEIRTMINILGMKFKDGTKTGSVSIANSIHVRVPKYLFSTYDFPIHSIPVFDNGPTVVYWYKDDLPSWCISLANHFDKSLKEW